MRRTLAHLVPLTAIAGFGACAATPIDLTTPPPSETIDPATEDAEVVVVRDSWLAAAVSFGIFVNNEHVGELGTYDYLAHRVPAGWVEMFAGSEARSEARFPVVAGERYYLEVSPNAGWGIARPQLIVRTPEEARPMLDGCENRTFDEPRPYPFELEAIPARDPGGAVPDDR